MSHATKDAPLAPGVRLHPGEEQRYRERTRRSRELLEKNRELIPTGHAGGMWYQLPYPVLLSAARGRGSGTSTATSTSTCASATGC